MTTFLFHHEIVCCREVAAADAKNLMIVNCSLVPRVVQGKRPRKDRRDIGLVVYACGSTIFCIVRKEEAQLAQFDTLE
jgi:hypothetical protein